MNARAAELARRLDLAPHPEGGRFRETFRSRLAVAPADGRPARAALTAIYALYTSGETAPWHRVGSDEAWCHLEGAPLRLWTFDPGAGEVAATLLGRLGEHSEPVRVVPAGLWQAAEALGGSTLVACFVAPGFDFADSRALTADPEAHAALARLRADLLRLV